MNPGYIIVIDGILTIRNLLSITIMCVYFESRATCRNTDKCVV